ncbi:ATP-binding protein [Sphingomonas sp. PB4P5]|uniref:ATP-binding protein n=1 Tax=Parasphingomonas puruogangriensis TaxID=3096155 RepID=UPI002FC95F74
MLNFEGQIMESTREGKAQPQVALDEAEEVLLFDAFRMFPARRLLLVGDEPVLLGGRAFDILVTLVRAAGSVVSKEDLLARAWPGVFVQDGSLRVQIAGLRKLLRDGQDGRRLILNNAGRGYSFAAPVSLQVQSGKQISGGSQHAPVYELPIVLTKVFGRETSIDHLTAALPAHRFVTIVGPGGIGKTTVALMAAAAVQGACRAGAIFVDFAPINDPALVPSALASALGLPVKSGNPVPDLVAALRDKQLLVLMDNCEHVIEAAAALAEEILSRASQIQILATSREPLRAKGERVHRLGTLESPPANSNLTAEEAMVFPAVQLFVERTNAALGGFQLRDADASEVGEICRRLDGIALAIELATAQVGTLGISGVAAALHDRFALLNKGLRTATPRHRTLSAAFDWSYDMLSPETQGAFRRLSVFKGGFTQEAAHAVAADGAKSETETARLIGALIATSLVTAEVTGASPSYRLLESARAYGSERLRDEGEQEEVARRHAEFFLDYFQSASVRSTGWSSMQWVGAYKAQLDNLRAALDWSSSASEWRLRDALTAAAVPLLTHLSLTEECRIRVEAALTDRPDGFAPEEHCEMQLLAGLGMSLLYTRGAGPDANNAWLACLAAAERNGDTDYQLRALAGLWSASFNEGKMEAVRRLRSRFENVVGDPPSIENALHGQRMRGMEMFYQGRFVEAGVDLQRVYEGYSNEVGSMDVLRFRTDQMVLACVNYSKTLWLQGFPDKSRNIAAQSVEAAKVINHDISLTYALALAACRISIITGDYINAENYIDQLFRRATMDRTGPWKYFAQCWKGTLLSRQGSAPEAVEMLSDALLGVPEGSFGMHQTRFLGELAYATAQVGEVNCGLAKIRRAIEICDRLEERWFLAELLRLEGEILLIQGTPSYALAEKCFSNAMELAKRQGALSFELRIASSLVRLGIADGSGKGRDVLTQVHGRFVEGFGTIDLVEAKRLLDGFR